jgi:hypothetical protein
MAQPTYSQVSVNTHLKNLIQYDNIVITDDNQIAFDVYFNVPDGLIARMWEWDRTGCYYSAGKKRRGNAKEAVKGYRKDDESIV